MRLGLVVVLVFAFVPMVWADGTLTYSIQHGTDDVVEYLSGGTVVSSLTYLELGEGVNGTQVLGLRFRGVQLSESMQIQAAYLQFTSAADSVNQEPFAVTIQGEASGNAFAFTQQPGNLSARVRTETFVSWLDVGPWDEEGQADTNQRSPDLSAILHEITTSPDWQRGNDIVLFLSGAGRRTALSYEGAQVTEQAPRLIIEISTRQRYTALAGNDDAAEAKLTGAMVVDEPTMTLGQTQLVGLRFPNINIAPGSPIAEAYIQFTTVAAPGNGDGTNLFIAGEASDDAAPFDNVPSNISTRARTLRQVQWYSVPAWSHTGQADLRQRTPNLAALVQEIVNRPGWQVGHALGFIVEGTGARSSLTWEGCQGEASCAIPELVIVLGKQRYYQVAQEFDDLEEYVVTGLVDEGSSDLEMCIEQLPHLWTHRPQIIGIRFQEIRIPHGALITDAYIQFACDEPEFFVDPVDLRFAGIAEDNTEAFSLDLRSVSSRKRTQTQVVWTDIPAWEVAREASLKQRTPSLAALVQEIVDRPGWEAYNALGFIVTGQGSRSALSYDGSNEIGKPHLAPKLYISYMP